MKSLIHNQRGYTFFLVFATLIIFSVLGLSLVTQTMSGTNKNKIRQDTVSAIDLADKGIDYAVNDIQKQLEDKIATGTVTKSEFETFLKTNIDNSNLLCSKNGIELSSNLTDSNTKVCIEEIHLIKKGADMNNLEDTDLISVKDINKYTGDEIDLFKRVISLKSTGIVNGKEKVIKTRVVVGTDAVPDQLRYSISTNDDGNLFLHGGVEIHGDIKTDGNLIISEQATWMSGNTAIWENSVTARIVRDQKSATPKLIIRPDKNVYILNTSKKPSYSNHIDGSRLNNTSHYTKISPISENASQTIANQFFASPNLKVVSKNLPDDSVNVVKKITDNYGKTNHTYTNLSYDNRSNGSPTYYNKKTTIFVGSYERYCKRNGRYGCSEYGYDFFNGDMEITLGNKRLVGTYFVNGNLTIKNTTLSSNALLYVKGNVEIRDSVLKGLDDNSTLIIFAEGDISISNISLNKDEPSVLKGFFYTNQNMILYGVGSNININGGISANRLILTALRGSVWEDRWGNFYTTSNSTQAALDSQGNPKTFSRLKVVYDHNLITQFEEFKRDEEEEFITSVNDPEILTKVY